MNYNFDEVISREGTLSSKWNVEPDHIPMTTADMDFRVAQPIIDALTKRVAHGIYGYTYRPDSYYEAVQQWIANEYGWNIKKEWICHSPGVVGAISYSIQQFTAPGDKVIIQPPVYGPFGMMVRKNGREAVENLMILKDGRYSIDFEDLKVKAADPGVKMMIICSPQNPTGRVWTREELEGIAEICLENNLILVCDEIHCDFMLYGHKFLGLGKLSQDKGGRYDDMIIVCTAASKTFNLAGLQTSNIIIPGEKLRNGYLDMLEAQHSRNTNAFGSIATEAAYRYGREWLTQLLPYIEGNVDYAIDFFEKNIPDAKVIKPESTYVLWVDCREWGMTDEELKEFFNDKAKVILNYGEKFGTGGEGFVRINLAFPRSVVKTALERIKKAYDEKKGK